MTKVKNSIVFAVKNGQASPEKDQTTPPSAHPAQSSGFFKRLEFLTPLKDQVIN